jgi:hypothetical protein
VGHAIGYFQSRRRHFVALLYTLPTACRGDRVVARLDTLNVFLPLVELHGIALTGLYQQLMLAKVFADYSLVLDDTGFVANHSFQPQDDLFLDPERVGIVEINSGQSNPEVLQTLERVDSRRILSAAELRNNLRLIQSSYAEFDLASSDYAAVGLLIPQLLTFCKDDYLIEMPSDRFEQLLQDSGTKPLLRQMLVHRGDDYVANTNVLRHSSTSAQTASQRCHC